MRDFVGTQLDVGDKVVYSRMIGNRVFMEKVEVIGFTSCKVKITPLSCLDAKREYHPANPDKLVIYEKVR